MLTLNRFARVAVNFVVSLGSRDSVLTGPCLACARKMSNTFREDYTARICDFEEATECQVLHRLPAKAGFCYPPAALESPRKSPRRIEFPPIRVITLRAQDVEVCSSFPYDENRRCFYVDPGFKWSASYASNACGHLIAHGMRKAIVRRRPASQAVETGIFLGGNGSFNYYHWLLEIVSKLQVLPLLPETLHDVPLLVNKTVFAIRPFREILDIMAPSRKIVYLEEGKSYHVRNLTFIEPFVTAPFGLRGRTWFSAESFLTRPEAVHYLRDSALSVFNSAEGIQWPRRIFLARAARRSYNQDELAAIAIKRGFAVLEPHQHSFLKQVGFFANAEVLVGPSGAAWSNLLFASSGCRALCWMPEELGGFAAFSNIAGILGIDLRYLLYSTGLRSQADFWNHSYRISPHAFDKALDRLLEVSPTLEDSRPPIQCETPAAGSA